MKLLKKKHLVVEKELLEFRVKLPSIKKREEVSGDTWCVGNERGKDYYLEFFFKHQAKPDKLN
jgi:hypothetical protein